MLVDRPDRGERVSSNDRSCGSCGVARSGGADEIAVSRTDRKPDLASRLHRTRLPLLAGVSLIILVAAAISPAGPAELPAMGGAAHAEMQTSQPNAGTADIEHPRIFQTFDRQAYQPGQKQTARRLSLDAYVGRFTIGGCHTLCEEVSYCREVVEFDPSNGDCTLRLNTLSVAFRLLARSCPAAKKGRLRPEHLNGRWQLLCPR